MGKFPAAWLLLALLVGAQLLPHAAATRGVGQQQKPAAKREQAVAATAGAAAPHPTGAVTATRSTAAAGPDPSSYSSVMAGTSYSKLGRFFIDPNQGQPGKAVPAPQPPRP